MGYFLGSCPIGTAPANLGTPLNTSSTLDAYSFVTTGIKPATGMTSPSAKSIALLYNSILFTVACVRISKS